MASDYDGVRATIEQYLEAQYHTPAQIAWAADPSFSPPEDGTPWLRPVIEWGTGTMITMGPDFQNRIVGELQIEVSGLPDRGIGVVSAECDTVRNIFNRINLTGVRFGAASGAQISVTEEDVGIWATRRVVIPFEADESVI